jgi:hypothetical protein
MRAVYRNITLTAKTYRNLWSGYHAVILNVVLALVCSLLWYRKRTVSGSAVCLSVCSFHVILRPKDLAPRPNWRDPACEVQHSPPLRSVTEYFSYLVFIFSLSVLCGLQWDPCLDKDYTEWYRRNSWIREELRIDNINSSLLYSS